MKKDFKISYFTISYYVITILFVAFLILILNICMIEHNKIRS